MLKIKFLGATRCVTGSCHMVTIDEVKILFDCGLFQSHDENEYDNEVFSFDPKDIDFVILSHSHVDHSGRIPLLFKRGFKGRVVCTKPTVDLSECLLKDAAKIQGETTYFENLKRQKKNLEPLQPLYELNDVEEAIKHFEGFDYGEEIKLTQNVYLKFEDAGHILGSAICELSINNFNVKEFENMGLKDSISEESTFKDSNVEDSSFEDSSFEDSSFEDSSFEDSTSEDSNSEDSKFSDGNLEGERTKIVFSGDIGNKNKDILKDPHTGIEADYLIMESTYGDKDHDEKEVYPEFLNIAKSTMKAGGNLIIPCFSLGKTQEIIYMLNKFVEEGQLKDCSVFIDSPLASSLTEVFKKYEEYFDRAAQRLIIKGDDPLDFKGLHFVKTNEEIEKVNSVKEKAIIIVAGGLHDGGRVANHLKNNLNREECGIIITSYQGQNSLGSKLLKGKKNIEISGEDVEVKAKVHYIGGLSCHADRKGLYQWVENLKKKPKKIFLVHGEEENIQSFYDKLVQHGYKATTVNYEEEVDLRDN